jgi:hypothetical protein
MRIKMTSASKPPSAVAHAFYAIPAAPYVDLAAKFC